MSVVERRIGSGSQCLLNSGKDVVQLGIRVHVAVASQLGVKHLSTHDLNLKLSRTTGASLTSNLDLTGEAGLKVLLQLPELGGVPSSAARKNKIKLNTPPIESLSISIIIIIKSIIIKGKYGHEHCF